MRSLCLAGRSIGTKIRLRRSTRRRRVNVDDGNGPGSIKRMECRALVNGGRARGSDCFCRLVIKLSFRPQFPLHRTDLLNPSLSRRFAVRAYAATIPPGKMAAPQEASHAGETAPS